MAWIPVNPRNTAEENRYILDAFDCEVLFFQQAYSETIAALRPALPRVRHWICIDADLLDPRRFQQGIDHGRRQEEFRHAVLGDGLDQQYRIGRGQHHDCSALCRAGQREQPGGVRHGCCGKVHRQTAVAVGAVQRDANTSILNIVVAIRIGTRMMVSSTRP